MATKQVCRILYKKTACHFAYHIINCQGMLLVVSDYLIFGDELNRIGDTS